MWVLAKGPKSVTFCDLNVCPFEAQNFSAPEARWPTRRDRNGVFVRVNSAPPRCNE